MRWMSISWRLLLSAFFFAWLWSMSLGLTTAQTPVTDSGAYSRLDDVKASVDGVHSTLGETNAGIVTLQQAVATQTAELATVKSDVAELRGVDAVSGVTTGWLVEELRAGLLAETALVFAVVVFLVVRLVVDVAGLIVSWRR